jgi:hypothetical protein
MALSKRLAARCMPNSFRLAANESNRYTEHIDEAGPEHV